MIGYELIPLQKICSDPLDATSFHSCGSQANIVMLISWDEEKEPGDGVPHGRVITQELVKIIEAAEDVMTQTLLHHSELYALQS